MTNQTTDRRFVIRNEDNGLLWNRFNRSWRTEASGQYSTYTSIGQAERALRKTAELKLRGALIVTRDPAQVRAEIESAA